MALLLEALMVRPGVLLQALSFAAERHKEGKRKGTGGTPYINHPIEVAMILATDGHVDDEAILVAAVLHDTVEDTSTTFQELEARFGAEVRRLVEEVTDDQHLPKTERKRLQIEHAPHLSPKAKLIKIADKISNVRDVTHSPPAHWPHQRRCEYLDWAEKVVAGLRGANPAVEALFDQTLKEGRRLLASPSDNLPVPSGQHKDFQQQPDRSEFQSKNYEPS